MSTHQQNQFKPPGKYATRRLAWTVAGVGTLFSLLLIALLYVIGKDEPIPVEREQSSDVIDLLQAPLGDQVEVADANFSEVGIELPQGGWVQQTDRMGNLVQQYKCESLDPNPSSLPTGWIEMQKPEIEIFLSENRLVRITGDSAIANAPKRLLESGEIAGHVKVEMFDIDGTFTDTINLVPSMVLTTPQASFDNFIGEITCDSEVRITSPTQTLVGRRLTVRFNDLEDRIEYLRLEELDYIEMYTSESFTPLQPDPTAMVVPIPTMNETQQRVQASAIGTDIEYYIVTLSENVTILQGDQLTGRVARGNKLTIAFSKESESSISNPTPPDSSLSIASGFGFQSTVVAVALTAAPTPREPPVRITCDDGLLMLPIDDPALIPSAPDETRLELFGSADSPIQLIDNTQGLIASGMLLRYEVQQDRSDLFGSPASLLMNETFTTANHLWIARQDGRGGVVGAGSMESESQDAISSSTLTWRDGVDFTFAPSDGDAQGEIEQVVCHGDVQLTSQDSVINCAMLDVQFELGADGVSSPSLAIATGNVKASSDAQVLWADEAHLAFTQVSNGSQDEQSVLGGSKADKMKAFGDVQVLLNDGGRAFCDQLDGDVSQEIALLQGNVVIAYKRMLMNKGNTATLTLNRSKGSGRWDGAGQALFLETPLDVSPDRRIDRPTVDTTSDQASDIGNITMRTTWDRSMLLDQHFNDGAGAIDLAGNVDVRSHQTPLDRSQMTGEDLRLEFQYIEQDVRETGIAIKAEESDEDRQRELRRVIARNNAQIEHRLWDEMNPDTLPVVYYIGGNHLEFDAITHETLAVGNGELLLRDPRQPTIETHQSALAGRGTTRFTWDEKLQTTKLNEQMYRIEMNGNVQMSHVGLDDSIGLLTSDKIESIAIDPIPSPTGEKGVSNLTLSGMDLQQLKATGSVYVATETRKVDCDVFDYNLVTGFAKLHANANRSISIVTEGTPYPVRAQSIVWNMDPLIDTITIRGLQGISPN